MVESKKNIEKLSEEKRELRMKVAAAKKEVEAQAAQVFDLYAKQMRLRSQAVDEREAVRALVEKNEQRMAVQDSGPQLLRGILNGASAGSLRASTLASLQRDAVMEVRLKLAEQAEKAANNEEVTLLAMHAAAGERSAELENLTSDLQHMQEAYLDELSRVNNASTGLLLSQSQLNQVKNDIAEIHRQVLRMQSTLARLDEQARRKSERSLIELGIIDGKPGEYSAETVVEQAKQNFAWPVAGRVTAGFRDSMYYRYFGVPHNGMDIAVAQGSAVRSAADGVVFVVRDGGATGYTYILIGHASGFATLYGHLSMIHVAPGQTVRVGQVIGLSGGEPGTAGAGLTTTGPHVHFEVIQGGVNINPMTVLP